MKQTINVKFLTIKMVFDHLVECSYRNSLPSVTLKNHRDQKSGPFLVCICTIPLDFHICLIINLQGHSLVRNQTIEGNVAFGRFGHSVTSLGDLNNDGCDGQYVHTICVLCS